MSDSRRAFDAEFEEFVSIAVHNLREPLRDVASFSQLLAENYASSLGSDASECLGRIQQGAATMQSLLADMVDYAAAGPGAEQLTDTDMEAVLSHALLCTEKQITERNATVTHDPLPRVLGDFGLLSKVLHHLIRNAIEYCGTPQPRVHISCKRADPDCVFCAQDNGPGIEPEFHCRIFGVFRRLHGREHPGNGLGLAFCKKAIEGLGGRMWMESTPGAGTKFYFTAAPADSPHRRPNQPAGHDRLVDNPQSVDHEQDEQNRAEPDTRSATVSPAAVAKVSATATQKQNQENNK